MKRLLIAFAITSVTLFGANFKTSFEKTIVYESSSLFKTGFNEVSKYGVTKQNVKTYNEENNTKYRVETLTKLQSKAIYKQMFWNKQRLDEIKSQIVANNIFDYTVHSGYYRATKDLQKVVNELSLKEGLKPIKADGINGSKTIARVNLLIKLGYANEIVTKYKAKRLKFLKSLNVIKTKQGKTKWDSFKINWTNRVRTI